MSLFRRPKKLIQRRVFSINSNNDEESDNVEGKMEIDETEQSFVSNKSVTLSKKDDKNKKITENVKKKSSLLSFGDEEGDDDGEIFQVKKSSHSKKVMKMMDKERRKKKSKESSVVSNYYNNNNNNLNNNNNNNNNNYNYNNNNYNNNNNKNNNNNLQEEHKQRRQDNSESFDKNSKNRIKSENTNSIHTEIRTDDFVLVVKKSEPDKIILNGRAALCAGKNDMSSEDEESTDNTDDISKHRFSKPDNFKTVLESGAIPDAAMIHAARKRRQKARELGDFVAIEEKPIDNRKGRLIRDDADDDISDDEERVDMSAITGTKEREERRQKFYSVQQEYTGSDSDNEMNEWENQQIRKGVTGAQVVTAQQESVFFSQFMIKPNEPIIMSTGNLLEQAYAKNCLEKPRQILLKTQKVDGKPTGPQTPVEVLKKMVDRYIHIKDLHDKHLDEIDEITKALQLITIEELECEQNAPIAANKFRFYQDLRGYVTDLVDCLDEKLPKIVELERKTIGIVSKQANMLIERRRQDVRDQAKEISECGKTSNARKLLEDDERIRRATEREGRRTRRRRDRERINFKNTHLDGMSSDEEIGDHEANIYKSQLEQIANDVKYLFDDTADDFSRIPAILNKFEIWKKYDIDSYKDTYFSLCLPKIMGPMIRLNLITWNPLEDNCKDLERMDWYNDLMKYGWYPSETEESLFNDPDCKLIPVLIEKIILPKVTEIIETCWDPLSTSQTLKLVGLIGRLCREFPTLNPSSSYMRTLFISILDKMKLSLDNDVFIPIFPKQIQESKSSFFQRQFCSGMKLFRNLLSWQGILADSALKELAILSLLNRYLLSALRVCTPNDCISKAYIIVNTLPRVWLQSDSEILESLQHLANFLQQVNGLLDTKNALYKDYADKITQILNTLNSTV